MESRQELLSEAGAPRAPLINACRVAPPAEQAPSAQPDRKTYMAEAQFSNPMREVELLRMKPCVGEAKLQDPANFRTHVASLEVSSPSSGPTSWLGNPLGAVRSNRALRMFLAEGAEESFRQQMLSK